MRPRLAESMQGAARRIAASLAWDAVALQYCRIIGDAVAQTASVDGVDRPPSVRVA